MTKIKRSWINFLNISQQKYSFYADNSNRIRCLVNVFMRNPVEKQLIIYIIISIFPIFTKLSVSIKVKIISVFVTFIHDIAMKILQ